MQQHCRAFFSLYQDGHTVHIELQDIHVLDAGCGTGHYTKALIDLGVGKFTLLDASPDMMDIAKEKLKNAIDNKIVEEVIQAQLPALPFESEKFDAVMFNEVSF